MKLSEMKEVLASGRIQLTKSLGQNFLHDGNQLRRIVAAAELSATDQVLEIGPGLGPLTELLLTRAAKVLAIEKDLRLVNFLKERFSPATNLDLRHDDALDFLRRTPDDWSGWKLVANLPYSVASPILVELAQAPGWPERLVATLQLEVAQRIMARPGSADYGVLSLLLQVRYEPHDYFRISASCFFPQPDVDSACIILVRRVEPLLVPEQLPRFTALVKRSFSQRRKMMLKLLKEDWPVRRLESVFEQVGLPAQIRAEAVTLDQFVALTRLLTNPAKPESANPES